MKQTPALISIAVIAATFVALLALLGCSDGYSPAEPDRAVVTTLDGTQTNSNEWACTDGTTILATKFGWVRDGVNGSLDADGNVPAAALADCIDTAP